MSRIIALTGPAGCGKSTIAEALDLHGFQTVKFAGPLKSMLRAFYRSCGLDDEDIQARIEGALKQEPDPLLGGKTPRWAMQTLGTEWGRNLIAQDLWVAAWRGSALSALSFGAEGVVADDCRFPNEAETVRALGGVVVELMRPGVERDAQSHASEAGIMPDILVLNDGPPAEIASMVHSMAMLR